MIELKNDGLEFTFPELHREARLRVEFQRTLRIPDDGSDYPLPPGLGSFPLRHVDEYAAAVPPPWLERGGVMLPMYQAEAMWLSFHSPAGYPFAVKVATGKVSAVTGEPWREGLKSRVRQDYLSIPEQPWLDGYCVEDGLVRQFVAMPLGEGYSAEEQLTGRAEHGGLQLAVYPMKAAVYERLMRQRQHEATRLHSMVADAVCAPAAMEMGLAPGGRMRQQIFADPHGPDAWDARSSRCFVHLANSLVWRAVTGDAPPTTPPTSAEYTAAGLPWFEFYSERPTAGATDRLRRLRSVAELGRLEGRVPLPENESVTPDRVVELRRGLQRDEVREGAF